MNNEYIQVIESLPQEFKNVIFIERWGGYIHEGYYKDGEFHNRDEKTFDCFLDVSKWKYTRRGLNESYPRNQIQVPE